MDNSKYTDGLFFNEPHPKAPEYILGSISFVKASFLNWLDQQEENEKGYVRIDIKRGRDGRPYGELNTWKPE